MRFVPSNELEKGTIIARDIIFTTQAAMLRKGTTLTDRYIEYLQNKGYLGAYVNDALSADIEIEETIDPAIFQEGVEAVMEENVRDMLSDNYEVASIVRQAILYHHENENGSGYPYGKEGGEIGIMARIIHVVDVYDALTSKRPYKEPYEPVHAFDYMNGGKDILFNSGVVDTLLKVIPAYPAGIDLFLSNGERALVIDHSANSLRPKVRLPHSGKVIDLAKHPDYQDISITHSGILPLNSYQGQVVLLNEERSAVKASKKTIMVVDDTQVTQLQVKTILEDEYNVELFSSTLDALNYIRSGKEPDAIIMEVNMPFLDGIQAIKKIREEGYGSIPVIFLTSVNDRDIVIQCKMMGSSDYILKPAKPVYIRERVYAAIYHIDALQ